MIDYLAQVDVRYLIVGIVLIGGLLALPLAAIGFRRLFHLRVASGSLLLLLAALLVALGALGALGAASLRSYNRLTQEQDAARVAMRLVAPKVYSLTVQPTGERPQTYVIAGDEWQIDARLLKWRPLATIVGFDTVYRLDRLSGRYTDLAEERAAKRTVYGLAERTPVDFWQLARRYHDYLPLADALYGSAAFVPMAEGAEYRVSVSPSGLVVRAANDAARKAVSGWK
ncbi:MAG TPA: hypothetical protein VGI18_04540 [Burkholderiales bacterium]|jgi:hypothetical protein